MAKTNMQLIRPIHADPRINYRKFDETLLEDNITESEVI